MPPPTPGWSTNHLPCSGGTSAGQRGRSQPATADPFDLGELQDPAAVPPPLALCGSGIPSHRPLGPLARPGTPPRAGAVHAAAAARRTTISLAQLRFEVVGDWLMNRWTPDSATTTRSRPPFLSPSTLAPQPPATTQPSRRSPSHPWMTPDRPPRPARCIPANASDDRANHDSAGAYPVPTSMARPCRSCGPTPTPARQRHRPTPLHSRPPSTAQPHTQRVAVIAPIAGESGRQPIRSRRPSSGTAQHQ
jgi:hypothetical protein